MKIIGISGISGSGKTTLINYLADELGEKATVLSFDNYYKPVQFQQKDNNGIVNFDLPKSLDIDQLYIDIEKLKNGKTLVFQKYDFNNNKTKPTLVKVIPADILLLEGLFVFHYTPLFAMLDYKIFVEADLDKTLARRLRRDKQERGIEEKMVLYQWNNHLIPAYKKYILPFKSNMDLIIENNGKLEEMKISAKKGLKGFV